MRRGEIWYARLAAPRKSRPVLLLTRDGVYEVRSHLTVAPLTRAARGGRYEVGVGPEEGLRQRSVINLDDIDTIPKKQLDRRITVLTPAKMAEVNAAIKYALDLD